MKVNLDLWMNLNLKQEDFAFFLITLLAESLNWNLKSPIKTLPTDSQ